MPASTLKSHHLLVSVQSLQSICTKKQDGTELIDNAELTGLCREVRNELLEYNAAHRIPELGIILQRFPQPRSYEPEPRIMFFTSIVARLVGLFIGALTVTYPLIFFPLLIVWLICSLIATLSFRGRQDRIRDDLRQIAECCSTAVMLIRNNEEYIRETERA